MRRFKISSKILEPCFNCQKQFDLFTLNDVIIDQENKLVCDNCLKKHYDKCNTCNKYFEKDELNKIGQNLYCEQCTDDIVQCQICGIDLNHKDAIFFGEQYFCKKCFNDNFIECNHCKSTIRKEQANKAYDQHDNEIFVCNDCKSLYILECSACGKPIYIYHGKGNYETYDFQDNPICPQCIQYHYGKCDQCGKFYPRTMLEMSDEQWLCDKCLKIDPQSDDNSKIYNPTNTIKVRFKKKMNEVETNELIGVQIEIMAKDPYGLYQFVKKAKKNKKIIFKRDGSLDKVRGIEINSQPATYNYHLSAMKWQYIFHLMNEYDVNDTNGCGIHFHISKNNFTKDQLKVLDYFVNNCVNTLGAIGGRNYSNVGENPYAYAINKSEEQYGQNVFDRYEAVNFLNQNTVELRFPASTSNYSKFKKLLSMVHNICKLTKIITFDQIKQMKQPQLKQLFIEAIKS